MTRRWTTWLAWSLWGLWVLLLVALLVIAADPSRPFIAIAATFAMVTVGALVASRQPSNPIGWIFCALGLGFIVGGVSSEYAVRAIVDAPGSLPLGVEIAWLSSWVQFPTTMLVILLLLLFPSGHPPSPRWSGVVWLTWAVIAVSALSYALRSGPLQVGPTGSVLPVDNPYAFESIGPLIERIRELATAATLALAGAAIVSLILRFRRARGDERQQLKWFAYATASIPAVIVSNIALFALPGELRAPLQTGVFSAGMVLFPVVVGVAILRYRLYDIDLLINRTLVYAAVTAVLAVTYFGAVILIQAALRPFTAGSELAVAASTLLVVALFQPIRARIQWIVDRRFYRARYDAARTLDAFGTRLRDQVELDAVRADLLGVVDTTIRPAHASVWLRGARR